MNNDGIFGIIYKVTNSVNGKIYIGQTIRGLIRRRWSHESKARRGKTSMLLPKAIKKYGKENFKWEIIENCDSKDEMDEMEFHYIKQFNSIAKNGYNITFGGEGCHGYKHSELQKKTMNAYKIGKKLSKESIEKRSLLQSYDWELTIPNGEIKIIRNLSKFCSLNGLNVNSMYRVARGTRNSYRGYKCRKLTNNSNRSLSNRTRELLLIIHRGKKYSKEQLEKRALTAGSKWVVTYPNTSEISILNLKKFCKENNINYNCMLRVGRGERTHHKGFKCKKINFEEKINYGRKK